MSNVDLNRDAEARWSALASRLTRAVLARRDVSYQALATLLENPEDLGGAQAIKIRIIRGTLKLSLFLQIISAIGVSEPPAWARALSSKRDWQRKAERVSNDELTLIPTVSREEIRRRLMDINCETTSRTFSSHIDHGTLTLSAFLQLLYVIRSTSVDRYIERSDLDAAAVGNRAD